jgi:hypothetical protein
MTELEQKLFDLLEDERNKNVYLLDLLLKRDGLVETESHITVTPSLENIGKVPWNIRKQKLEKQFRKVESVEEVKQDNGEIEDAS